MKKVLRYSNIKNIDRQGEKCPYGENRKIIDCFTASTQIPNCKYFNKIIYKENEKYEIEESYVICNKKNLQLTLF